MGIIQKHYNNILYYEIDGFNKFGDITHLFSSRIGWNQNRIFEDLSTLLDIPVERIFRARQVHGKNVILINNQENKTIINMEADGLITDVPGTALCTFHADCVPIYFYDNVKKVIGIAHAGWKGTLNNIVEVVVDKMVKYYRTDLDDIFAAIGPSIGVCCYEIGEDVEKLFMDRFSDDSIFVKRDDKTYLNLWRANTINLLNAGINFNNIYHSDFCTSCHIDTLYSYRREKGTKNRMIAAIMLKN